MEDILACRICLIRNVKLYDLFSYDLNVMYEDLTGLVITPIDGLPQYACLYCARLLRKCFSFKKTCYKTHDIFKYAQTHNRLVTTEYIDRLKLPPIHKFSINNEINIIINPEEQRIKEELLHSEIDIKQNFSSDEEPLSKIVKKCKKEKCIKTEREDKKEEIAEDYDHDEPFYESDTNDNFGDEVDVIVLTKEQQIQAVQARKNSLNYQNSYYKCDQCFKGFLTHATYENHMQRHDPSSGPHSCEVCGTRWSDARALRSHRAAAHERRFLCRLCGYTSNSRHRAREHSKWHNGHLFICKICGASFSKSTSHLTHVRLRHPSQNICSICGESFIGQVGLNMHMKKAHRGIANGTSKEATKCSYCDAQFQTADALKRHLDYTENDTCDPNLRPCLQCGEGLSSDQLLKEHLKTHLKCGPVKCSECNRTFAHERSLAGHHQRAHSGAGGRGGPGGGAAGGAGGDRPRGAQPRGEPVVCEICGKKCISKATLLYHQRTHTGEKPYHCTDCPKKFSVYQRLQIHVRTHTGERPYKCAHCPKAFKHKAALNRHDRVHSGAKPYSCSHCGKCFSQSNSMKLHVRTVHLRLPAPYRAPRDKGDAGAQC